MPENGRGARMREHDRPNFRGMVQIHHLDIANLGSKAVECK